MGWSWSGIWTWRVCYQWGLTVYFHWIGPLGVCLSAPLWKTHFHVLLRKFTDGFKEKKVDEKDLCQHKRKYTDVFILKVKALPQWSQTVQNWDFCCWYIMSLSGRLCIQTNELRSYGSKLIEKKKKKFTMHRTASLVKKLLLAQPRQAKPPLRFAEQCPNLSAQSPRTILRGAVWHIGWQGEWGSTSVSLS